MLNKNMKVLICALQLEERGFLTFSWEQLVLECWKRYPDDFGLKGYEQQYPDSKKITEFISLNSINKIYQLEIKERKEAYDLAETYDIVLGTEPPTPVKNKFAQELNEFMENVLDKDRDWENPDSEYAFKFWGIPLKTKGEELTLLLEEFDIKLNKIRTVLKGCGGELILENGRSVTWEDLKAISEMNKHLRERFGKILEILKRR